VKDDLSRIYGEASLGSLVDIMFLDERQYRSVQACGDKLLTNCAEENDPNRTLLGAAQKSWLKGALGQSTAKWKLLGNNDMLMSLDISPGSSVNPDQWDGYAAERAELGNFVASNGIKNVVAATGDIHTFFAGTVTTTGRQGGTPWASEFVGGSATSTGIPEALGLPAATLGALAASDPHINFYDFEKRGFGVMSVTPDTFECELKSVDALTKGAPAVSLAKFSVADGTVGPQRIS
jgi:alkaline phosphatase D